MAFSMRWSRGTCFFHSLSCAPLHHPDLPRFFRGNGAMSGYAPESLAPELLHATNEFCSQPANVVTRFGLFDGGSCKMMMHGWRFESTSRKSGRFR
jgi:hypothetical protein